MILDKFLANLSVSVNPFALCEVAEGWRLRLPSPPCTLLHFVLQGSGRLGLSRTQSRDLRPNYMAIVPTASYHSLETGDPISESLHIDQAPSEPGVHRIVAGSRTSASLVVACGLIDVRYGQALNLFQGLDRTLVVDLSGIPQVRNAFDQMLEEQQHPVPGSSTMTSALMLQCLLHMFRRLPSEGDRALNWLIALRDARLARVIEKILADPAQHHSVESLADEASMSRSAFAALFNRSFGQPPMGYVNTVRMQRAVELLEGTMLSVDEIAARVGFASRSHFAQSFKKHTGRSPASFRDTTEMTVH
jgi:AraC family transcriptional activator of mtrCDE